MKNKKRLLAQAKKLYSLGWEVELKRERLRQLVKKGISFECTEMKEALKQFQLANSQWKKLESEHLKYKNMLLQNDEKHIHQKK